MKLSPQPAGMLLPFASQAGPAVLHGEGAFAATMQDLMAPRSAQAVVAITQGPTGNLTGIATQVTRATWHHQVHTSAGEEHIEAKHVPSETRGALTPSAGASVSSGDTKQAGIPQFSVQSPLPPEENSELAIPMPETKHRTGEGVLPQPLPAPQDLDVTQHAHASPRAEHRVGAARRDATRPETRHLFDTLTSAPMPLGGLVSVSMPQLSRSEHAFAEKNAQRPVQLLDKAGGNRRRSSVPPPIVMAFITASSNRNEPHQVGQKEVLTKEFATVMKSQSPAAAGEKDSPAPIPRSAHDVLSGQTTQGKQDHEATAVQVDSHVLQEAGKGSSTVTKVVVGPEPPFRASIDVSPIQRPESTNIPSPTGASHGPGALIENHHAQVSPAQVLQRMDTAAPSGAVQLRSDARHLDVGISSGELGWVEVRATASPSGRVDAALHVQTSSSAHLLTAQAKEIETYARGHLVELGQISVGVGTGDTARGHPRSMQDAPREGETMPVKKAMTARANSEPHQPEEKVSFISVRA